ncbi:MAG: hypothetical protein V4691_03055 [Pseudomonadota bacterium]
MKRLMIFVVLLFSFVSAAEARPARWCGWYMRTQMGHDPGPSFNLARNWARFGAPAAGPAVGTIVVWRSHVGRIVGRDARGQWLVNSGNDSNRVRTRARSLRGVIAYRWPGSYRLASR